MRKDWCWNTVEGASVAGCRSGDWCGNWQFSVNAGWHDKRSCYHRATDGRADGFRDLGDSKEAEEHDGQGTDGKELQDGEGMNEKEYSRKQVITNMDLVHQRITLLEHILLQAYIFFQKGKIY